MFRVTVKPEFRQYRNNVEVWENIDEEDVGLYDEKNMATHGMNRNLSRDIPFFFDNLKVVQRRLLYTMARMGLFPPADKKDLTKNMTKAAGIVGETIKTVHPHGDMAAWKALVYMRQPWRHLLPLADIKGNYGNAEDPNEHAQMRYPSCRLSQFAYDCFFDPEEWDLKSDLVDKKPSFNGKDIEPIYLPAKYPLFLMSWGSGIGHGLSTSTPGFLPQDAMQSVINMIDDPKADFVLYPEDPLGCTILDKKIFKKFVDHKPSKDEANLTFRVRSNYYIKNNSIVVYNTPFEVNPVTVQQRIADLVRAGKLDGIVDIEIELKQGPIEQLSGKGDTAEIWIELKKGFDPHILMEKLYKVTDLETTFSLNCVYVSTDRNVKFHNLRESILQWIDFRRRILKRMFRLRLGEHSKRIYVLEALIMLFEKDAIDSVVKIIKTNTRSKAAELLVDKYDISDYQAKEILDMRIRDLSPDAHDGYVKERTTLLTKIDEVQEILKKKKNIDKMIKRQMEEGIKKYSRTRLSKVINLESANIEDTKHTLTVTNTSFIKKLASGDIDVGDLPDDSKLVYMEHGVPSTAKLFMFTPYGRLFSEFVHKINMSSKEGVGMYMRRKMKTDDISFVAAAAGVQTSKSSLVFVTRKGGVKQTKLDAYFATAQNSVAIKLIGDDSLVEVVKVDNIDKDRVLIYTKNGKCGLFNAKDITLTSRTTVGVSGIRLEPDDEVVGACLVRSSDTHIITVSGKGEVKKFSLETSLTSMKRGDSGVSIMPMSETLSTVFSVDSKTTVVPFAMGSEIKEFIIADIPLRTRLSNGDKVINSLRGDKLVRILD